MRPHGAMRKQSTVIVIGGDVRHFQLDRLRAAFGDAAVEWIPTRASDPSSSRFKARLLRPDTSLVVMLCGLVRHQHARDIVGLCRRHGRRCLHLHRSANVHRIVSAKGEP
jgi:hypothetical protein